MVDVVAIVPARGGSKGVPPVRIRHLTPGRTLLHYVADAARQARPWGVDVASGVETDGQTDPNKVRTFIQRVRDYEHSHTSS